MPSSDGDALVRPSVRYGSALRRLLLGTLLAVPGAAARAQPAVTASNASEPTPLSTPKLTAEPKAVGPETTGCPDRPPQGVTAAADVLVTLDPETLWRPRGSDVKFTVSSAGTSLQVSRVQVCMGWSASPAPPAGRATSHLLLPAPVVRPVASGGSEAVFAATVPDLQTVPTPWPFHLLRGSDVGFTAIYTVPVADMVVVVTTPAGTDVVMLPVGVTSVIYALSLVAICVTGFFLIAWAFVSRTRIPGRNLLLRLICSQDGYASLSQFQVLLWTVTIGASAVYAMVLSGNLINLTSGTLVLLGIAGGAALLARISDVRQRASGTAGTRDLTALPPVQAAPRPPRWADLVVVDGNIDVTRVQMLIFTMISAAFVTLKVIINYSIPDVPDNFLLLMGISNGIYVAGRQLPDMSSGGSSGST